jgi:hypothetical protein
MAGAFAERRKGDRASFSASSLRMSHARTVRDIIPPMTRSDPSSVCTRTQRSLGRQTKTVSGSLRRPGHRVR